MNWQEVCEHPALQNLPFKIELNAQGQVVMSPVKVYHSAFQGEISHLLRVLMKTGRTLVECAVETPLGIKVADVAWVSTERFAIIKSESACSIAPEICIEVLSSSNTLAEIKEKAHLYFSQGALEVWSCDEGGNMRFFEQQGELKNSKQVPQFPYYVNL